MNNDASTDLIKIIATSSIADLAKAIENYTSPNRSIPLMVAVIASPGTGKTWAINWLILSSPMLAHTGKRGLLYIEIFGDSTRLSVARLIIFKLTGQKYRKNVFTSELRVNVFEALKRNDIRCLYFDESDRLDYETLDFIRSISDDGHTSTVLSGTTDLKQLIESHPQVKDRTQFIEFKPLGEKEIIEMLLPNLNLQIQGWFFNQNNPQHVALGKQLWKQTAPSIRKLVTIFESALIDADKVRAVENTVATLQEITADGLDHLGKVHSKNSKMAIKNSNLDAFTHFELEAMIRFLNKQ